MTVTVRSFLVPAGLIAAASLTYILWPVPGSPVDLAPIKAEAARWRSEAEVQRARAERAEAKLLLSPPPVPEAVKILEGAGVAVEVVGTRAWMRLEDIPELAVAVGNAPVLSEALGARTAQARAYQQEADRLREALELSEAAFKAQRERAERSERLGWLGLGAGALIALLL